MTFQDGEITISPYTLYWVQMPSLIGEYDRIEMLKRNVFIIECQYSLEDYGKLIEKREESSAFFFNLDKILLNVKRGSEYVIAEKIALFISRFSQDKSVVHTKLLDNKMREIFQNEGIIYLEKNFNDKEGSAAILLNLLKPLFSNGNITRRTDIRLLLFPNVKFKVDVYYADQREAKSGYLKDISMGGVGVKFDSKEDLNHFSLKDQVMMRLITHNSIYKIPLAIVTRKTPAVNEVGVSFNIVDTNMIKEETANFIVKIIYQWIKDAILTYGKI
ncbi:MAG: hypothetical protein A2355_09655 [Spirochaetes bacterium RIFOXYB1_FULL_32_8]|nr:MAG: hypothetical protein A2Y30_01455 [Spirochaetes bacterium GWE1_32_154]OHD80921.1 MAG: hypothetical protein A2355_09655 [Spirochaetes bacterium RIFOXYB1_FULL_32_8]